MSAIILGGGRSSRLGQDKISLRLGGKSLLQRTINRLSQLDGEIILVLAQDQTDPILGGLPSVKVIRDVFPCKGPLIGTYSGLKATVDEHCLTVACDMPFLNIDLLRYMKGLTSGFDIVIPRVNGQVEPLHAIYSNSCLNVIEQMIAENDLKVSDLLERVRVRYVGENEVDSFDPDHLSWFNINVPDDLERARQIVLREGNCDPS